MFGVRNNNRRRPNAQVDHDNYDDNADNDDDNIDIDDVDNVYNSLNDYEYQVLIRITLDRQMIVVTFLVIIDLMALRLLSVAAMKITS